MQAKLADKFITAAMGRPAISAVNANMSHFARLFSVSMLLLPLFASAGDAATIDLACSRDSLPGEPPAAHPFFVQIRSSERQVTSIELSTGGWCDSRDGQVTEEEISFPCAIDLAGRRITFSFTLDKRSGAFEQRFFVGGKLQQVGYGICTWKTSDVLLRNQGAL
jgi:hypothetical protein